jgi:hypothetical protein
VYSFLLVLVLVEMFFPTCSILVSEGEPASQSVLHRIQLRGRVVQILRCGTDVALAVLWQGGKEDELLERERVASCPLAFLTNGSS